MGNSCRVTKKCAVCEQTLHNLDFHSNDKGRIDIKRFCKNCKPIYMGIRKGIFEEKKYVGKSYNCSILNSNVISVLEDGTKKEIFDLSLEEAKKLVKKGGAHILSNYEIQLKYPIQFYQQEWSQKVTTIKKPMNPNKLSKKDFISLLNEEGELVQLIDFEEAELLVTEQKATVIDKLSIRLLPAKEELVLSHYNKMAS